MYKAMRYEGGDLRPVLKVLVLDIGWGGVPKVLEEVDGLSKVAISGILGDWDESESNGLDAIKSASENAFLNARRLLRRVRADIPSRGHILRIIAEAGNQDASKTEAIVQETTAKALSPAHIFIPFVGFLRIFHSHSKEARSLLKLLNAVDEPSTNAKVVRVLNDSASVKEIFDNLLLVKRTSKPLR